MMSSPKNPAPAPLPANVSSSKLSTNQGGIALPWFSCRRFLPLNWGQSRIYNPRSAAVTQKVGKSNRTTGYNYFGDLFGLCACCQVDYIESLEVAGTIVWSGFIERDGTNPVYAPINLPDGSRWRFYWGNPDQPLDDLVLSGCGEEHPNYLDQAYLVGQNVSFGSNSTTPPSVRVLVERAPRFSGLDENRTREGASMVTAMAELIGNDWFGLGLPEIVDVTSWNAQCVATKRETTISIPGDSAHAASMGYGSVFLDSAQKAQAVFAQIMEHFDGWLRPLGETLELGRFPHDGVVPVGLTELSYHDFVSHPQFSSPADVSASDPVTAVSCVFSDREYNMEDNAAEGFNTAARQRLGEENRVTLRRPFITTSYQAAEQAHEFAKFFSRPEASASCTIRRERLNGMREGDRFILNDAPSGYRQVIRITERTDSGSGGEAQIRLVEERGLAPLTFITPTNPTPNLPPPNLVAIAHARMFQLPRAFADYGPAPVVVPLAERPAAHVSGFDVHYSSDDASYDFLSVVGRWALRGTLVAGISTTAPTLTLLASGFDLTMLQSQSATAQADDTLMLVCGYEILSIGGVTALGGNQYSCAVLRGRRGSAAATHAGSAECYVIARANLEILQHANFPRTTTARYFKLPTYTPDEQQDLSAALRIVFTFDDAGVVAPTSLVASSEVNGVFLQWINPNDPTIVMTEIFERDTATLPNVSDTPDFQINATSYHRGSLSGASSKYYTLRNRDTIGNLSAFTGPVLGTSTASGTSVDIAPLEANVAAVRALIASITRDLALEIAAADQHAAALLQEVKTRNQTFIAEQTFTRDQLGFMARDLVAMYGAFAGNEAAIIQEKKIRIDADTANATATTTLASSTETSFASVTSTLSAQAGINTATATSLTSLTTSVGTVTSSVSTIQSAFASSTGSYASSQLRLDAGGKVVSMLAIASSGGPAGEVGTIIFGGATLQSDTFVSGSSGWELKPNGDVEIGNLTARGELIGGSPSGQHSKMSANFFELRDGATLKGFFGFQSGLVTLDMGNGHIQAASSINSTKLAANSSASPRTTDSPLYTAGGCYIGAALDVLGHGYFHGDCDVANDLAVSGNLGVAGNFTPTNIMGSGGYTAPMWDGAHWLQFRFIAGVVECQVDFSTTFNLS